jgi:perosamine synthetase
VTLAIMGGKPLFSDPVSYPWPRPSAESEALVISQLRSGKLSIYDKSGVVGEFEDTYASLHGVKYGLVTSSGTAALHSAYYSLGISPGDEVL